MNKAQLLDDGREFWTGIGEHISEAFIRGYAANIRQLSPKIADDLLNIAEHSNRLAVENAALRDMFRDRLRSLSEVRMRYFIENWPDARKP